MKKQLFLTAAVLFTAGMIWMSGCKKDDTTPPTVTLNGSASMTISLNTTTSDPGAMAMDDEDGDISSSITSDWSTVVNINLKGNYTVTYSVSDAAGNSGTATRTVTVVNDVDFISGTYNVTETGSATPTYTFSPSITASNTQNKVFSITNFGGFYPSQCSTPTTSTYTLSGATVNSTVSWGGFNICGSGVITGSAAYGSGTLTNVSPAKFTYIWQWNDGTNTETVTGLYTHQ